MPALESWEWMLLVAGCYLALSTLVRLMNRRREAILEEVRQQAETEVQRLKSEQQAAQRQKRRNANANANEKAA